MNRTSDLFDDRIADWLEDDPSDAPAQLLTTVLAALPSVPQRRDRWLGRPQPLPLPLQLAAATIVVLLVSLLGLLVLRGPTVGPEPSPSAALRRVDAPLHVYVAMLPPEWNASLAARAEEADRFEGPAGAITVSLVPIPAGQGQDDWADAYLRAQASALGGTCSTLQPDDYEPARIGSETGRLYTMPCLPGWLGMTAVGDRGFDVRLTPPGDGSAQADARQRLLQVLLGFTFLAKPGLPQLTETFVSPLGGYSIGYVAGAQIDPATATLAAGNFTYGPDDPWVDAILDPNQGPNWDIVSWPVPAGMTPDEWIAAALDANLLTTSAFPVCATSMTTEPIVIDGVEGVIDTHCAAVGYQAFVVDGGRGYSFDIRVVEPVDIAWFRDAMTTVRLDPGSAVTVTPAPTASPAG